MISTTTMTTELDCTSVQLAIQDLHDGEVPAIAIDSIDVHASHCAVCADFSRSVAEQRRLIRALPARRLPTATRSAILIPTAPADVSLRPTVPLGARVAASVAVAAGIALSILFSSPVEPLESELARVEADMHRVLVLAGRVINQTEDVTLDSILGSTNDSEMTR